MVIRFFQGVMGLIGICICVNMLTILIDFMEKAKESPNEPISIQSVYGNKATNGIVSKKEYYDSRLGWKHSIKIAEHTYLIDKKNWDLLEEGEQVRILYTQLYLFPLGNFDLVNKVEKLA